MPGGTHDEKDASKESGQRSGVQAGGQDTGLQQLQSMTGLPIDECEKALEAAGGNVDVAAGHLMGWS